MGSVRGLDSVGSRRRDGNLVIEIDEHHFCADAFQQSESGILDRDAFLAFVCENLFTLLHDASAEERTWWVSLCQAVDQGAADAGAGVRLDDGGEDRLPIDPPRSLPRRNHARGARRPCEARGDPGLIACAFTFAILPATEPLPNITFAMRPCVPLLRAAVARKFQREDWVSPPGGLYLWQH